MTASINTIIFFGYKLQQCNDTRKFTKYTHLLQYKQQTRNISHCNIFIIFRLWIRYHIIIVIWLIFEKYCYLLIECYYTHHFNHLLFMWYHQWMNFKLVYIAHSSWLTIFGNSCNNAGFRKIAVRLRCIYILR